MTSSTRVTSLRINMPGMESLELKVLSMFMWQSHGRGFMIEDGDCFVPRNDVPEEALP